MESLLTNQNKDLYNLRKRLGGEQARSVMEYWYHFHIDDPETPDEALYYYLLGGST